MTAKYFTTADGRIVRGEVVSLPVLAVNYEVGIAEYVGESSSISLAQTTVLAVGLVKDFEPLKYDHRPTPRTTLVQSGHSIIANNGVTYHEWIEVPVAPTEKVA
jgi:hypothetical protein